MEIDNNDDDADKKLPAGRPDKSITDNHAKSEEGNDVSPQHVPSSFAHGSRATAAADYDSLLKEKEAERSSTAYSSVVAYISSANVLAPSSASESPLVGAACTPPGDSKTDCQYAVETEEATDSNRIDDNNESLQQVITTSFPEESSDAGRRSASTPGAFPVGGRSDDADSTIVIGSVAPENVTIEVDAEAVKEDMDVEAQVNQRFRKEEEIISERARQQFIASAAQASVVQDGPGAHSSRPSGMHWTKELILAAFFLTIVVGVVALIVMFTTSAGSSGSPSPRPSFRPPPIATPAPSLDPTTALIQANALDGGTSLNDPSSPQYQALQWLLANSRLSTYSDRRKLQRYSLATLYYSTNGVGWTNSTGWLSDSHECTWYFDSSPACSDGEFVSTLWLRYENLVGTLPREVALLSSSLARIDLRLNSLFGSIPSEVGLLTNMEGLFMGSNDLSFTIPSELGQLKKMETLELYNNRLSGTIPSDLSGMTNLEELYLFLNKLTGTIPSEVDEMTNLNELHLYNNNLSPPFTCPSFVGSCWISCSSGSGCREL